MRSFGVLEEKRAGGVGIGEERSEGNGKIATDGKPDSLSKQTFPLAIVTLSFLLSAGEN